MKAMRYAMATGPLIAAASTLGLGGCGDLSNLTASLGSNIAGQRGTVRVLFINNTPHRAVFTFGSYDQTDQSSEPDFEQFGLDDNDGTLDGNSTGDVLSIECARVFGIGTPQLLELIEENASDTASESGAFVNGVDFFDTDLDNEDGEQSNPAEVQGDPAKVGSAPPFEALLGVDFPCNSLLIFRFEFDDLGPAPFRVDFELIPSETTR